MEKWEGLVAVVTGASAGIGKSTAVKLASLGMKVAALARREDRLKSLVDSFEGKGEIRAYKCDVMDDEAVSQVIEQIEKDMGAIRVLINNAGIVRALGLIDINIKEWKNVFNTNVFGMFSCIRDVLNSVKKRPSRDLVQIININSIAGHSILPIPLFMIYTCTKHCVTLLTRALIKEIAEENLNVRVSSLSPGMVKTEIQVAARISYMPDMLPYLEAEDIAEGVVSILSTPQNVIISELTVKSKGEFF